MCILLPPRSCQTNISNGILKGIVAALATRFNATVPDIHRRLNDNIIEEWGKVKRVDSDAGDTMHAFTMVKRGEDNHDTSFVRVHM